MTVYNFDPHRYLPQISDGSSILNIMNQCMYLGSSLSKAGADFRSKQIYLQIQRSFWSDPCFLCSLARAHL